MYLSALTLLSSASYRDPRRDLRQILIDHFLFLADSVSMTEKQKRELRARIKASEGALKIGAASFIMNNAEELFQALSHYSKSERQAMLPEDFDRFEVKEKYLSDRSVVLDFGFRTSTYQQRKCEAE